MTSALVALTACSRKQPVSIEARVTEVVEALTRQNPNPVNVSPSGALVLVKSMHPADFELQIRRRQDGVLVAHDRARDTQLAPTWRFDDGAIAFLADHGGDQRYRLFVLEIDSGRRRMIENAPLTAATALRWEPRGTRVAYLVAERGRRAREVVVVDTAATPPAPVVALEGLSARAGFVWSPDGTRLASVSHDRRGTLVIGRSDGGGSRRVLVAPDAELRSLAWSQDGQRLLLTIRRRSDEHFGLAEVSATTGAVLRELRAAGDVTGPLYLPNDAGIAFHVNHDGEVGVQVCARTCDDRRRIGPDDGTSIITGFSPDGDAAWVLHTGRISPPALWAVDLASGSMQVVHRAHPAAAEGAVRGERIDVESADRVRVPAYLWRAVPVRGRPPAALIRVRGGPSGQALRTWDPAIQLLVQRGVHVISVNYRGSSGYGASFEHSPVHGHTERVADVLAAREFAERELAVPPDRIILLGHSYGALLVAEAAKLEPSAMGSIVLLSYVGPAGAPRRGSSPRRIVAFHGETDVALSPGQARRRLEASLGQGVFAPPGRFLELPREGHSFRRVESWARVYGTVLTILQAGSMKPRAHRRAAHAPSRAPRPREKSRGDEMAASYSAISM